VLPIGPWSAFCQESPSFGFVEPKSNIGRRNGVDLKVKGLFFIGNWWLRFEWCEWWTGVAYAGGYPAIEKFGYKIDKSAMYILPWRRKIPFGRRLVMALRSPCCGVFRRCNNVLCISVRSPSNSAEIYWIGDMSPEEQNDHCLTENHFVLSERSRSEIEISCFAASRISSGADWSHPASRAKCAFIFVFSTWIPVRN
jgi:hypothetical protein